MIPYSLKSTFDSGLELRTCNKYLGQEGEHTRMEIVQWWSNPDVCYTLAAWDRTDETPPLFDLKFVGDRPFKLEFPTEFWELAAKGQKYLDNPPTDDQVRIIELEARIVELEAHNEKYLGHTPDAVSLAKSYKALDIWVGKRIEYLQEAWRNTGDLHKRIARGGQLAALNAVKSWIGSHR